MKKPKTLAEVIGKDLIGFQLVRLFFIKIDHGMMGMHPALFKEEVGYGDDEIIFCDTLETLEKLAMMLPREPFKIVSIWSLYNKTNGFAFAMDSEVKTSREPLMVLSDKSFNTLVSQFEQPFKWAPGVLRMTDGPDDEYVRRQFKDELESHGWQ